MSAEALLSMYNTLFILCLILCGAFLILSVCLFFLNKVGQAFKFLSGRAAAKAIDKITSDSRMMERSHAANPEANSRRLKGGNSGRIGGNSGRIDRPNVAGYFQKAGTNAGERVQAPVKPIAPQGEGTYPPRIKRPIAQGGEDDATWSLQQAPQRPVQQRDNADTMPLLSKNVSAAPKEEGASAVAGLKAVISQAPPKPQTGPVHTAGAAGETSVLEEKGDAQEKKKGFVSVKDVLLTGTEERIP